MRCVLLRDDDTNAFTPVECLETLYRPFLARGLAVNLATIPEVSGDARTPSGEREGFLPSGANIAGETLPLASNAALTRYLHENPGYHIAQHGCHHNRFEFAATDRREVVRRIEQGRNRLREAGFKHVPAFVAPHDRFSRVAYEEVARRFRVISTGWFELGRLPLSWRLRYLFKKVSGRPHWRVGHTQLLSHPGCLLSYTRPLDTMLDTIKRTVAQQDVTVLVTHWWEYFRNGRPDESFIRVLHATADFLASAPDLAVLSFSALVSNERASAKRPVIPAAGASVIVK